MNSDHYIALADRFLDDADRLNDTGHVDSENRSLARAVVLALLAIAAAVQELTDAPSSAPVTPADIPTGLREMLEVCTRKKDPATGKRESAKEALAVVARSIDGLLETLAKGGRS